MFRLQPIYDPTKKWGLIMNGIGHTRFSLVGSKHVGVGYEWNPKDLGMIWKCWCWVNRRKHMGVGYGMESTTLSLGGYYSRTSVIVGFDIRICKSGLELNLRFRVIITSLVYLRFCLRIYLVFRVIIGVGYKWKTRYLGFDT